MCQGFYNVNMTTITHWDFSKESVKVYDDFLTKEEYIPIYQYFLDNTIPWYWMDGIIEMSGQTPCCIQPQRLISHAMSYMGCERPKGGGDEA